MQRGGNGWDERAFQRRFLVETDPTHDVPRALVPLLFRACDADEDGILSEGDFLASMAVARHGSEAERLMMLYNGIKRDTPMGSYSALVRCLTLLGKPQPTRLLQRWLSQSLPRGYLRYPKEAGVHLAFWSAENFAQFAGHSGAVAWRVELLALLSILDPLANWQIWSARAGSSSPRHVYCACRPKESMSGSLNRASPTRQPPSTRPSRNTRVWRARSRRLCRTIRARPSLFVRRHPAA